MFKNIENGVQLTSETLGYLSIKYNKLNVGIIGGGKAGFLKAKKFILNNSNIEVLSKDFIDEFKLIKSKKMKLLESEYSEEFILNKHLIIIAINDDKLRKKIVNDCDRFSKIFIDCTDAKNSLTKMPFQSETENFSFGITTKNANPKMSVLVAKKICEVLKEYDNFEAFTYDVRCKARSKVYKKELLEFVITDEFKEIWENGKAKLVLKLFYDDFEI